MSVDLSSMTILNPTCLRGSISLDVRVKEINIIKDAPLESPGEIRTSSIDKLQSVHLVEAAKLVVVGVRPGKGANNIDFVYMNGLEYFIQVILEIQGPLQVVSLGIERFLPFMKYGKSILCNQNSRWLISIP